MYDLIGTYLANNRYRVVSFIGEGGMAQVYKVWDEQRACYLAMKMLRSDLAMDRVVLRRFHREAETLSRLQHPSIVRFYGMEQDGERVFLLMEYIDGISLAKEIFQTAAPFPEERIFTYLRPVCSALHYAHQNGVVHCDIKSANIMIERQGRVCITDFGIARLAESTTTTLAGLGTPGYAAPEQIMGKPPLPQTDIYALGVVLYEMATGGERPFTGEEYKDEMLLINAVNREHLNIPPPSPRKYNPRISPALEAVILRCLEKSPRKRYPDALMLLHALENASGKTSSSEQLKASMARLHPAVLRLLIGALAVVLLLIAFLIGSILFNPKPTATQPPYLKYTHAAQTVEARFTKLPGWDSTRQPSLTLPAATLPVLQPSPSIASPAASTSENPPASTLPLPPAGAPTAKVLAAQGIYIRRGPSTAYEVIAGYPQGALLQVIGRNQKSDWLAVLLENGQEGWVFGENVELSVPVDTLKLILPPPTPTLTLTETIRIATHTPTATDTEEP